MKPHLDKRRQRKLNTLIAICGKNVALGVLSDRLARTLIMEEKVRLLKQMK